MLTKTRRKTHPMVLTAAGAVTFFSIIGSAAVAGLIPTADSAPVVTMTAPASAAASPSKPDDKPFQSVVTGSNTARSPQHRDARAEKTSSVTVKASVCKVCGVIESITTVEHEGDGSGLGAVAGGVVGGVAGNQVGKGKGNTIMTIIGLGGGAYAGHEIEKRLKSTIAYVVKVRMDDGSYRNVTQPNQPEHAVGDHVRVVSGSITST